MTDETISFFINDQEVEARPGSMLIEAADAVGIRIPRFCYHKKLSVAANCRMCMVEVEKAPKPLPACATPVTKGMKVYTNSPKALAAQRGTMEFLLINHPLDCPICDQGGECELQDVAMGYGGSASQYGEQKRVVRDKDIGPLIATDLTRCILCTRCVRFGEEIAGLREMGAVGRGERTEIGTFMQRSVDSELSGNVIDLCPVGALTAKPSRYTARPWELVQHALVAPHDCIGSNLYLHTKNGTPNRVVPRDNEAINEAWLSDRDRYAYQGVTHPERLRNPMVKRGGQWQEASWEEALAWVTSQLRGFDPADVGALVAPWSTLEEQYLAQAYLRGLGIDSIDHRLLQNDFSDDDGMPLFPWLGTNIEDLERQNAVLLVGSNVRKDQPIAALRLRKAWLKGARIMAINPLDHEFRFTVDRQALTDTAGMLAALAGVAKAILKRRGVGAPVELADIVAEATDSEDTDAIAANLLNAESALILLGSTALMHPAAAALRALCSAIAANSSVRFGYLTSGPNAAGAWLAGVLPHRLPAGEAAARKGLNALAMFRQPRKAYVLYGVEPEFDSVDPSDASSALRSAEFVVCLTAFSNERMEQYAHVLLPVTTFGETEGTYVNAEGRWQSFSAAVKAPGDARPGWKVLRVLAEHAGLPGFDRTDVTQVRDALRAQLGSSGAFSNDVKLGKPLAMPPRESGLQRVSGMAIYGTDPLVRRASALQATEDGRRGAAVLNPADAERLGLTGATQVRVVQGEESAILPLTLDGSLAQGCVYLQMGTPGSSRLGNAFGTVTLKQA